MDLLQGRSARQRNDFVLRLGCWMVTLSMVCGLVIQPPKAKAIVAEASLATSVIWAFMQSAGITFNGTGMNSSSWAEGIEPYLREFTEATDSAAKSFWHWLGYDGAADFIKALSWSKITHPSTMPFPSVTIPPAVAKKLARFTVWFAEKVGLSSGGESKPVYSSSGSTYLNLADGSKFYFFSVDYDQFNSGGGWHDCKSSLGLGTIVLDLGTGKSSEKRADFTLSSGATFSLWVLGGEKSYLKGSFKAVSAFGSYSAFDFSTAWGGNNNYDSIGLFVGPDGRIRPILHNFKTGLWGYSTDAFMDNFTLSVLDGVSEGASSADAVQPGALSPTYDDTEEKATIITIPGLDTEIAGINELLQAILDKLAANELTTSATIAQQPTPEQPDEEKPDLDGLGLPALGAALMTRFPFSIPWDVVRGIKLLAAPAEAPYWEVDFLAPIAGRVGGWKGSTKVVIDMGQYEIIGQLCRWTSTIGFCLVLAAGTKKLIWTA